MACSNSIEVHFKGGPLDGQARHIYDAPRWKVLWPESFSSFDDYEHDIYEATTLFFAEYDIEKYCTARGCYYLGICKENCENPYPKN